MANPNPSPKTRFGLDNKGGRPKGARDRLSAAFLKAMSDDFDANGVAVVEKVRVEDPATYLRVVASLLPKEVEISRRLFDDVSEDELAAVIEILREEVEKNGTPPAAEPEPPPPRQTH
jgi:cellulose synthase/poly-beta-1,6-N-acetylglucosamine synthase-like glycosyltransferase